MRSTDGATNGIWIHMFQFDILAKKQKIDKKIEIKTD